MWAKAELTVRYRPAGVALALNPFVLQELHGGRPTQAWLAFPALALAGVWGAKTPMRAIATGLAVAAAGWVYWYAGLVVGLLAVATGLGRLVVSPTRRRDTALLGLAALVAAVAVAPAVLAMQDQLRAGAVPGLLAMDGTGLLAPLAMRTQEGEAAGLHVLAPLAGVAGALFEEDGKLHFSAGPPSLAFAGVGAAVIAGVLAARARRPAALVLALTLAALSFLAAAGPAIVVGDTFLANRPWIWAAAHVDLIRRWWWPGRAIFGVFLAIAWIPTLITFSLWILCFAITHIISISSLVAAAIFPIMITWRYAGTPEIKFLLPISVLLTLFILFTHRANIQRLRQGTEKKLF